MNAWRAPLLMVAGAFVLVASFLSMPQPLFAQSSDATVTDPASDTSVLSPQMTQDQLNSLVARMSDSEVRQLLLDQLASAATTPAGGTAATPDDRSVIDVAIDMIGLAASRTFQIVSNTGTTLSQAWAVLVDRTTAIGITGLLTFLAVIALGAIAEIALGRFLKDWRIQATAAASMTITQTLAQNAKLFLRDTLGQFAFFLVVAVALLSLVPEENRPVARIMVVWLIVVPRFCGAILRFLLAPSRSAVAEIRSEVWTRRYIYRNLYGMVIVSGVALALIKLIQLTETEVSGAGFWLNLIIFVWLGVSIVTARKGITDLLRGKSHDLTAAEDWVARAYPTYAVISIILTWVFSTWSVQFVFLGHYPDMA